MEISLVAAFLSGVVIFIAPCTLPIVPGYIAYLSGGDKNKIIKNSSLFLLGFLLVFLFFGLLAGLLGGALAPYRIVVGKIGGAIIIFFGLYLVGLFKINYFNKNLNFFYTFTKKVNHPFVFGMSFAAGWTPCVGPVLAGIFFLATFTETFINSLILFLFFSIGFVLPFFGVSFIVRYAKNKPNLKLNPKVGKYINIVLGLFLVFIGILLISDKFFLLIRWGFEIFGFLNYESLENFL